MHFSIRFVYVLGFLLIWLKLHWLACAILPAIGLCLCESVFSGAVVQQQARAVQSMSGSTCSDEACTVKALSDSLVRGIQVRLFVRKVLGGDPDVWPLRRIFFNLLLTEKCECCRMQGTDSTTIRTASQRRLQSSSQHTTFKCTRTAPMADVCVYENICHSPTELTWFLIDENAKVCSFFGE